MEDLLEYFSLPILGDRYALVYHDPHKPESEVIFDARFCNEPDVFTELARWERERYPRVDVKRDRSKRTGPIAKKGDMGELARHKEGERIYNLADLGHYFLHATRERDKKITEYRVLPLHRVLKLIPLTWFGKLLPPGAFSRWLVMNRRYGADIPIFPIAHGELLSLVDRGSVSIADLLHHDAEGKEYRPSEQWLKWFQKSAEFRKDDVHGVDRRLREVGDKIRSGQFDAIDDSAVFLEPLMELFLKCRGAFKPGEFQVRRDRIIVTETEKELEFGHIYKDMPHWLEALFCLLVRVFVSKADHLFPLATDQGSFIPAALSNARNYHGYNIPSHCCAILTTLFLLWEPKEVIWSHCLGVISDLAKIESFIQRNPVRFRREIK